MPKIILDNPRLVELCPGGIVIMFELGNKDQVKAKIEKILKSSSIICDEVRVL